MNAPSEQMLRPVDNAWSETVEIGTLSLTVSDDPNGNSAMVSIRREDQHLYAVLTADELKSLAFHFSKWANSLNTDVLQEAVLSDEHWRGVRP